MKRRESLKYITLAGISTGILVGCTPAEIEEKLPEIRHRYPTLSDKDLELLQQRFFTDEERETSRILANLIIPADGRSGNAESAGVVEFMEFTLLDRTSLQTRIRGGLRWLDHESLDRYQVEFRKCSEGQKTSILDDIAYPDSANPEHSQGVAFFNTFRDLVASGFWSSKTGVDDLKYSGNVATVWQGAPKEVLDKLGVAYDT